MQSVLPAYWRKCLPPRHLCGIKNLMCYTKWLRKPIWWIRTRRQSSLAAVLPVRDLARHYDTAGVTQPTLRSIAAHLTDAVQNLSCSCIKVGPASWWSSANSAWLSACCMHTVHLWVLKRQRFFVWYKAFRARHQFSSQAYVSRRDGIQINCAFPYFCLCLAPPSFYECLLGCIQIHAHQEDPSFGFCTCKRSVRSPPRDTPRDG